ncbi:MAG: hypothetical protein ACI8ZN_000765 [Bacteroidia bacterium]|jgi:hypothetical protein
MRMKTIRFITALFAIVMLIPAWAQTTRMFRYATRKACLSNSSWTLPKPSVSGFLELGRFQAKYNAKSYAGFAVNVDLKNNRLHLLAGVDEDKIFYNSVCYQYHLAFFSIHSSSMFTNNAIKKSTKQFRKYGGLYVGSEFGIRNDNASNNRSAQNFHIGLALINSDYDARASRLFVQFGFGLDYTEHPYQNIRTSVRFGLNIQLCRKYIIT